MRLIAVWVWVCAVARLAFAAGEPRIADVYNFCRESDYRVPDSQRFLFEATREQLRVVHAHHLCGTWALQYDALMDPAYQKLMKEQIGANDEIGAWWEIPRALAEKAGLKWRGAHDWDSTANVGFSPGYTPDERRRLVDVYMADFKAIFARYPKTVGSWYIDEVTLAYMAEKYGIVASCNCKDQVGTDGYTLWGGYWNQAYYPSRLNAYMPAQSKEGQIDVPVFRMLGSDPIYQYGNAGGIHSLEPVYADAGGSVKWVDWFLGNLIGEPCLAFGYTQAGQENSFGWEAMKRGFEYQMGALEKRAAAGEIRVETLEKSGEWFKSNFEVTPATSVVCLDDWRDQGHKTVWYDSRFYRVNFFWDGDRLTIRDLHRFDERMVSPTHDAVLTARSLSYGTLPIVERSLWKDGDADAGAESVAVGADGKTSPMEVVGEPAVSEASAMDLKIEQRLKGGGMMTIVCGEKGILFQAVNADKRALNWAWMLHGGEKQAEAIVEMAQDRIGFRVDGYSYALKVWPGGVARSSGGLVQLRSATGGMRFEFGE